MRNVTIATEGAEALDAYGRISIGFEIRSIVSLDALLHSNGQTIEELPTTRRWKDYDAIETETPMAHRERFKPDSWAVLGAFDGTTRVGGAIVAHDPSVFQILETRDHAAVLIDIRVANSHRQQGIGKQILEAAIQWARARGCAELLTETQETNVDACRFYRDNGGKLLIVKEGAYEPVSNEAMIIWSFATV